MTDEISRAAWKLMSGKNQVTEDISTKVPQPPPSTATPFLPSPSSQHPDPRAARLRLSGTLKDHLCLSHLWENTCMAGFQVHEVFSATVASKEYQEKRQAAHEGPNEGPQ